jgi:hypothetical protein
MTSVDLLTTEIGRLTTQVGRIDFYVLPIQKPDDFTVVPHGIVSFDEAHVISLELSHQTSQGRIGRYEWRKSC